MPPKQDSPKPPPSSAPERLKKASFLSERTKEGKIPIPLENRAPADVLEHFRKRQCSEGHTEWDEKKIMHSIDHHAFILYCVPCEEWYVLPTGGVIGIPGAGEMVAAAEAK